MPLLLLLAAGLGAGGALLFREIFAGDGVKFVAFTVFGTEEEPMVQGLSFNAQAEADAFARGLLRRDMRIDSVFILEMKGERIVEQNLKMIERTEEGLVPGMEDERLPQFEELVERFMETVTEPSLIDRRVRQLITR